MDSQQQIYRWAFTLHNTEANNELREWINENCKKFIYQLEKGEETGKEHFQGQFSLKKKITKAGLVKSLKGTALSTMHLTPTHDEENSARYCGACETRVAGPWHSEDYESKIERPKKRATVSKETANQYLQREFGNAVMRPWQMTISNILADKTEHRSVHWVFDPRGNQGKTWLAKYCYHHYDTGYITFGKAGDLLYLVSEMERGEYIFDLSRCATVAMEEIYGAIEAVRNGFFVSTKYKTRLVVMEPPTIVVFSNHKPDMSKLSVDRWRLWRIEDADDTLQAML